jgi:hypothetical protein
MSGADDEYRLSTGMVGEKVAVCAAPSRQNEMEGAFTELPQVPEEGEARRAGWQALSVSPPD